jgi:hypothetical protein
MDMVEVVARVIDSQRYSATPEEIARAVLEAINKAMREQHK